MFLHFEKSLNALKTVLILNDHHTSTVILQSPYTNHSSIKRISMTALIYSGLASIPTVLGVTRRRKIVKSIISNQTSTYCFAGSPFLLDVKGNPSGRIRETVTREMEQAEAVMPDNKCEFLLKIPGTSEIEFYNLPL